MSRSWFNTDKAVVASFVVSALIVIGIGQAVLGQHDTAIIGGQTLSVELARTPKEQAKGLSGRDSLPADACMLFVYGQPTTPGFWMRDMRFDIDIIWIGPSQRVVDITSGLTPDTYPEVFRPSEPVRYVLEVSAGFAQEYDIKTGDSVKLPL